MWLRRARTVESAVAIYNAQHFKLMIKEAGEYCSLATKPSPLGSSTELFEEAHSVADAPASEGEGFVAWRKDDSEKGTVGNETAI